MEYWRRLSRRQRLWLAGALFACATLITVGWLLEDRSEKAGLPPLSTAMTIRQIAPQLETTGKALAKEVQLPVDAAMDRPLAELGVEQSALDRAAEHLWSHRGRTLKYYVYAAVALFALVFLVRLGRPDGSPNSERQTWYPRWPYLAVLSVTVLTAGFALGKSPNPMEGIVKVFKAMVGLQPSVTAVAVACVFFILLAAVGNKLVCGWACPFGALQELVYSLPILRRLKRRKVPFIVSNTVRIGIFAAMLLTLFGAIGGNKGFVLYHLVNPFNLFNLEFETALIGAAIAVSLFLGLAVYRPFCQWICPFGLVSWVFERVSLFRIHVDHRRCTQCGACSRACPSGAAGGKVAGKFFVADCYSCARCLNVCPHEALAYRAITSSKPTEHTTDADAE